MSIAALRLSSWLLVNLLCLPLTSSWLMAAEPSIDSSAQVGELEIETLNRQVIQLYQQGKYDQAVQLGQQALEMAKTEWGEDHPKYASILNNLAGLYEFQGRFADAQSLYRTALSIKEKAMGSEHPAVVSSLNNLAALLVAQGRYAEAEPLHLRALEILEKAYGPRHPQLAASLNNLASLYYFQGRYAEAEPMFKRSLAIKEDNLGKDHVDIATSINNLAALYDEQGRYQEAEPLYRRALAIREQALGPSHPDVATSLNNLAFLLDTLGKQSDAEPLYRRALSIQERSLGPDHPDVATTLNNLAEFESAQGSYQQAEALHVRALAMRMSAFGPEHVDVAASLNNLALLYDTLGKYAKAESLYREALEIREQVLEPGHPDIAQSLNNLASLVQAQGRYHLAEPMFKRALALREAALGETHPAVAIGLNNLAGLYEIQGRFAEAEPLYQRALGAFENALGESHPAVASALNNLAALFESQGRFDQAEALFRRALAIRKQALGQEHPDVAASINNLAGIMRAHGRFDEAAELLTRSLAMIETALGEEHPLFATGLNNLAAVREDQGKTDAAKALFERALRLRLMTLGHEHPDVGESLNNLARSYEEQLGFEVAESLYLQAIRLWQRSLGHYHPHVATALNNLARLQRKRESPKQELSLRRQVLAIDARRLQSGLSGKRGHDDYAKHALPYLALLAELKDPDSQDLSDAVAAMQLARRSDSAEAFHLLAQRLAVAGSGALALLVRQRQDLLSQMEHLEKRLLDSYGLAEEKKTSGLSEQLRSEIKALRQQEHSISDRLHRDFPAYAEFEGSQLVGLDSLRQALAPDEAVLAWVLGDEQGYLLVVRKDSPPRLHALPVKRKEMERSVRRLRAALDLADPGHPGRLVPFPAAQAALLFGQLFGSSWNEDLKGIDRLLLVPEGALTLLPFPALLTDMPKDATFPVGGGQYAEASWLVKRFDLSVLPSLSSITALRTQARQTNAANPFLGIGDPLLDDHPAQNQGDQKPQSRQLPLMRNMPDVEKLAQQAVFNDEHRQLRLQLIRQQASLPDTADELQAIADIFGSDKQQVLLLREEATEARVKRSPLDSYGILSFATHGALAGELGKGMEPGLILTPPAQATDEDDGYLSLSEVAALKLNADWVVLSACNTAGGAGKHAEGFTGLAKAFAYAGARSLLVSHWAVSSQATVHLMGRLFNNYKGNQLPRAKAHRQAMLQMVNSGDPLLSHPSMWAPFVVVGDGG